MEIVTFLASEGALRIRGNNKVVVYPCRDSNRGPSDGEGRDLNQLGWRDVTGWNFLPFPWDRPGPDRGQKFCARPVGFSFICVYFREGLIKLDPVRGAPMCGYICIDTRQIAWKMQTPLVVYEMYEPVPLILYFKCAEL